MRRVWSQLERRGARSFPLRAAPLADLCADTHSVASTMGPELFASLISKRLTQNRSAIVSNQHPWTDPRHRPLCNCPASVKPERKERILTVSFSSKAYLSGSRRRALWAYSCLSDRKCKRTARVSRTRARVLQIVRCSYDFANIHTIALLT